MSDLHRAIEAELDAHRPDVTPPFAAVRARKRALDRRRNALAGAALSVVAVAGIAVLPSALGPGGGQTRDGRNPVYAAPSPTGPAGSAGLCEGIDGGPCPQPSETALPPQTGPGSGLNPGGPLFTAVPLPEQAAAPGATTSLTLRFRRAPGSHADRAVLWVLRPGSSQPTGPDATSPDVLRTLTVSDVPDSATEVRFAFDGLSDSGDRLAPGAYGLGYALVGVQANGQTASSAGPYGAVRLS